MNIKLARTLALIAVAGLLAAWPGVAPVRAQSSGGPYRIDAVAITGGGTLSGGTFRLRGTFGQSLLGAATAPGYTVSAGFVGPDVSIFHNGFEYQ